MRLLCASGLRTSRLFHEPTVADDEGLAGQRVRLRGSKKQSSLGHVVGRGELAVDRFPQHHVVNDLVLGNPEFLCLLGDLLVH